MTADDVREILRAEIEKAGSAFEWCVTREPRVSQALVSNILSGKSEPSKSVLDALGFKRVHRYEVSDHV
jgi:hypothetical protein